MVFGKRLPFRTRASVCVGGVEIMRIMTTDDRNNIYRKEKKKWRRKRMEVNQLNLILYCEGV